MAAADDNDKNFAFEQVETELELIEEGREAFAIEHGEPDEWLIEWDGGSRTTSFDGMAYYAAEISDGDEEVTPL